jgi:hypothetical protein
MFRALQVETKEYRNCTVSGGETSEVSNPVTQALSEGVVLGRQRIPQLAFFEVSFR